MSKFSFANFADGVVAFTGEDGPICDNPECSLHKLPCHENLRVNCGEVTNVEIENDILNLQTFMKIEQAWEAVSMEKVSVTVDGVPIVGRFCRPCRGMFKIMGVL